MKNIKNGLIKKKKRKKNILTSNRVPILKSMEQMTNERIEKIPQAKEKSQNVESNCLLSWQRNKRSVMLFLVDC